MFGGGAGGVIGLALAPAAVGVKAEAPPVAAAGAGNLPLMAAFGLEAGKSTAPLVPAFALSAGLMLAMLPPAALAPTAAGLELSLLHPTKTAVAKIAV